MGAHRNHIPLDCHPASYWDPEGTSPLVSKADITEFHQHGTLYARWYTRILGRIRMLAWKTMQRGLALVVLALWQAAPAFPQSLKDRAQEFYGQGKFEDAAQVLERHLSEHPADFDSHLLLGLCYQQAGDPLAASAAYQRAVSRRPSDSIAHFRLAQAQYFAGRFREAEKKRTHFAPTRRCPGVHL